MLKNSKLSMYIIASIAAAFVFNACSFAAQELDRAKYIGIDEVKAGMDAYCLTVYEKTNIEKFGLEVVSVVRNYEPGRDAILVKGTDPRFIHTGPVAGCSGSPVYINGRLAGALAFALSSFAKDPLYGVTPIEEMLRSDSCEKCEEPPGGSNLSNWNFSNSLDLMAAADTFAKPRMSAQSGPSGASALPNVMVTSQLPSNAIEQLNSFCSPLGLVPAAGIGSGSADANLAKETKFEPGSAAVVPLVEGDMKVAALGTVTDVVGDKVYAFGHSFLGYGQTDLPLATGQVSTIVSSLMRSFKFGNALEVKGALTADESTAIVGRIGKKAKTIPLTIKIDRYNDSPQTYKCRIVNNEMLSPMMVMTAVSAATSMRGPLPPDHSIIYKITIGIDGFEPIVYANTSTGDDAGSMLKEAMSTIGLLLNNPYKKININSLDIEAAILSKNMLSRIWSVTVSDTRVKPGQNLDISVVVAPYLAEKKTYELSVQIPRNLKPGEYEILLTGPTGYEQFLRKTAPEKFRAENLPNLLNAMHNIAEIRRDKLYMIFVLPASGVAIENALMGDLPASKAALMQDDKRTLNLRPYQNWIEKTVTTESIIADSRAVRIKVEE